MRLTKADNGRIAISKFNNGNYGRGIIYSVSNLDKNEKSDPDSKLLKRIEKANRLYNVFFRYDVPSDLKSHFTEICKIASKSTKVDLVKNLCKYKGYEKKDGRLVFLNRFSYKVSDKKNINDVLRLHVDQCMTEFWQDDNYKKAAVAVLNCICQGKEYSNAIKSLENRDDKPLDIFMKACKMQHEKEIYVKDTSELEEIFTLIIKKIVSECNASAYYENDVAEIEKNLQKQIIALKNIKSVKKKASKKSQNEFETIVLSDYRYKNSEEYRMNTIIVRMRKSLKRGTNRQIAIMMLQAIAKGNLVEFVEKIEKQNRLDELKKFIFSINKDYHRTNIIQSVRKMDLRVQTNENRLDVSCVNNTKKRILSNTLERYASSKAESDKVLLDLKKLLFKYFEVEDKYEDRMWSFPKTEEYFDDEFVPYSQTEESVNANTLEMLWQDERISRAKDKIIKKRINFVNYGKYLAVVKNSQDEFEIYWAAYIKEYIEKEYVNKNEILLERDCKRTSMMTKCWKHMIQFLCSKYIDIGKSVYHFVIPESITNSDRYDKLGEEYSEGISSFLLEIIKAEETRQREIAKVTSAALSNFSRAVIDYNSPDFINGKDLEDILSVKDEILKLILRKDCYRQVLRFYGGMSQNTELSTVPDITGMKLILELLEHLKKIRNLNFHYKGKGKSVPNEYTKVLVNNDIFAYKQLIRQHYYSNNVYEFYKEEQIVKLVESLYSNYQLSEAQIPAFRTVWKRKDMCNEIATWNSFTWQKDLETDNGKKLRFESALYFILKEIYYHDFILRSETKKEFISVVNSKVEKYGNKESFNKEYFNAGRNFQDFLKNQDSSSSFGTICQAIIQECNQQNTKGEESYKHFKIWLSDCIREAFKQYITNEYAYLLKPSYFERKGEPTYLDSVDIKCFPFMEGDVSMYEWYTLAHFISPRQLNLFVGELKDYVQYRQDVFRRSVYAGQYIDKKAEDIAKKDMKAKVKETMEIIAVLDFVRVVSGRVSNVFEDYYDSKEAYAEFLRKYIDFPITEGKACFESLRDFCCKTFSGGQKIDIYADDENPKVLRNAELARMYAGGDFILNGYNKISVGEIAKYYENIEKVQSILSKGLCENAAEQNIVKSQQDLKRRITLNEVTDFYSLVNDLLGNLISFCYLRERDYMYLLLGFYYMALRSDDGWDGEIIDAVQDERFNISGGFVLYQILAVFDFGIELWYKKDSKWEKSGGQISNKIGKFYKYHKESFTSAIRLFMDDEKYDREITNMRNYVDHSKYYVNYDKSLIGLYNEFYAKFFSYSDKLRKSVLFNFQTILDKYFVKYNVKFRERAFYINNNLSSEKFTYKLKDNKTVEIDARNSAYLNVVKQILEYRKV